MKKIKVVIFGSCFSGRIINRIDDFQITSIAHHLRSDIFLEHIQGIRKNISKEQLENILQQNGNVFIKDNSNAINCQNSSFMDKFIQRISTASVLIIDNQYELQSVAYSGLMADISETKIVFRGKPTQQYRAHGQLSIERSLSNLQEIVSYFKALNSNLKIFFLPYPYLHMNISRINRIERSKNFDKKFNISGVYAFPSFKIPGDHIDTNNGDLYFAKNVYESYGNKILELLQESSKNKTLLDQPTILEKDFQSFFSSAEHKSSNYPDKSEKTPYNKLPEKNFWKLAVATVSPYSIQGLYQKKFEIKKTDILTTAGSCFAQHISRYMQNYGFNYKDYEPAPSGIQGHPKNSGYGIYSARYGNIYTIRHLLQLFERAFGEFVPSDEVWVSKGRFFDPYRPTIEPNGFESLENLEDSKKNHLSKVRTMFTELDIFVFTLGLTEAWVNSKDGVVYPICPGVSAGSFDATKHVFHNFNAQEMFDDFNLFITKLRAINKNAKFILTVSPVPLTATATENHVLNATSYSKSALRAVAGMLYQKHACVDYFPSYEIISSFPFRGMFYEPNLREVSKEGVRFAMQHFFNEHQLEREPISENEDDNDTMCDEILLEMEHQIVG